MRSIRGVCGELAGQIITVTFFIDYSRLTYSLDTLILICTASNYHSNITSVGRSSSVQGLEGTFDSLNGSRTNEIDLAHGLATSPKWLA